MTLGYVAWITVCVVWGTTYLAIRVALETMPVLLLAGFRWLAAGLLLAGIVRVTGRTLPHRRRWGALLLVGILMNVIGNGLVVWAEQYVASGLTAVVIATVPFWSVAIEGALPLGERVSAGAVTGLTVGFIGIIVLVWPELTMGGAGGRAFVGGVVGIQVACAGWALGTSYLRRRKLGDDPLSSAAMQMMFSGIVLVVLGLAAGEWAALHFTGRSFAALGYLTVAGSLVAYPSYLYAIRHLPISLVSLYAYINPLIAVALGALLLGEPFSIRIGAAAVLVLAGMWIVGRARGALVFPGVRRRQGLATRAAATATDGRPGSSPRISK